MIITDIVGNTEYLSGLKSIKRFRSVSGEKTLAFLVLPTEQNSHSFDMVQEESVVEFKGEEYRIKQMNEKNRGQTFYKEVVAIHTFFDLIDDFQYDLHNGSMTFDAALNFVLGGTGYTWNVLDTFYAQDFQNFGNGNRLSLFQEILNRYSAEFTLNGTYLTFRRKIGNATDFQFRYRYNIKTINRSVNTNNLSTYIKGYGKKNEDGSYVVKSEYTSPNASIFGIRHAKPVSDEKYTTLDGLNERLVAELKDTPEVSITLDFVDLRKAGYPYDVPNEGDDVFLIYEPMKLDLETRIIDITEEFTEFNDYPIKTDVTLANYRNNMVDQFVEFSRTQKTVSDIVEGNKKLPYSVVDDAILRATEALQSAQTELEFNNGIIARSKDDPNKLVLFNSAGVGVSVDGGATFRQAMTAEGFVADLITVGTMLFDRLQGGSLKLGQAYQNGVLEVYADKDSDGILDVIGRIDTDGAYFPLMSADNIRGNVENAYQGPGGNYYFDFVNGNDSNHGLNWTFPKKNPVAFIDSIPKNLNGYYIGINVKGDIYGGIKLEGFHNGSMFVAAAGDIRPKIFGRNIINRCNRGMFQFIGFDMHGDSSTGGNPVCAAYDSDYAFFYDCKVYGNNAASHAFWYDHSSGIVQSCQAYGITDRGLYATKLSRVEMSFCKGDVPVAVLAEAGAIVVAYHSRWAGSVVTWNSGYIQGQWNDPPDYGESAPPPPPPATEQTFSIAPSTGDNWSTSGYWTNDEVKQGNWGYGDRYGLWYVDLSAVKGKQIVSATITVYRAAGGNSGGRNIHFRTHRYTSRASRPGGAPAMSGEYVRGTIAVGQTVTFDITDMIQNNIANGIDTSIGVYTTGSTDYMSLGTTPTINIRYK